MFNFTTISRILKLSLCCDIPDAFKDIAYRVHVILVWARSTVDKGMKCDYSADASFLAHVLSVHTLDLLISALDKLLLCQPFPLGSL